MVIHKEARLAIYFGDARHQYQPLEITPEIKSNILKHMPFRHPATMLNLKQMVFLNQVHGSQGITLDQTHLQQTPSFSYPGDFLITQEPMLGLGISTADCLPIVLYDSIQHIVATIHAGWRGTMAGIAITAYQHMVNNFGSQAHALKVYFGPCAKVCCYRVCQEVLHAASSYAYYQKAFKTIANHLYFDLPLLNKLQLLQCGIPLSSCKTSYNFCTMCNVTFCSYRRQKEAAGRQMTIATLI